MSNFFQRLFAPERRWILISVIVGIGAIILFNLLPRGGSGGRSQVVQTGPSEQLQAAQLQAQTALAQSAQSAQVQLNAQATELAAMELQGQIALALGTLDAETQDNAIMAQLAAMQEQTNANLGIAQMNAEINLAEIESERAMQERMLSSQETMMNIQAEQNIARDMLFAQLQAQQSADETARTMAMLQAQRDVQLTGIYAGVENNRIDAEIERAELDAADRANDRAARSRDRGNRWGFAGSLLSAGLALFSDVRLKENVEWLGVRDDGLNMYGFNYAGDKTRQAGYMAQEVQTIAPEAYLDFDGYGAVNVARLH